MLALGLLSQFLLPIVCPEVNVAFLDGAVFRSWAGLGLVELGMQATFFGLVLLFGDEMLRRLNVPARSRAILMGFGLLLGAVPVWLAFVSALRISPEVMLAWAGQTVVQLVVGVVVIVLVGAVQRWLRLVVAVLFGAVFLAVFSLVGAVWFPAPIPDETLAIEVEGAGTVRVDCFLCDSSGPRPAVVLLHGVEGASGIVRRVIHYPNAYAVHKRGYNTFFVRYFDASPYDDLLIKKGETLDVDAIERIRLRDYRRWIAIAQEAIKKVRSRDDVDKERVVVIGYSLGCYVGSGAIAGLGDDRPTAFVGNFGSIWPEVDVDGAFPRTQLYHGEEDEVVPVASARTACQRLEAAGVHVDLNTYPEQGHVPTGPASADIRRSTEAFLNEVFRAR